MREFENQNRPRHLEPWQHNFEWSYWKEIKFNDQSVLIKKCHGLEKKLAMNGKMRV